MRADKIEHLTNSQGPEQGYSSKFHDDITGQLLKDDLVKKAR